MTALIDAHVHFHRGFDDGAFLDGAARNFRLGAGELGVACRTAGAAAGCLLFSEMRDDHAFRRFRDQVGRSSGAWRFEPTEEEVSLVARRDGDEEGDLVLISGRQVRTREGLEVLALATGEEFPDGLSFDETLERVHWSGAIPVVPWGFGKWWFERGVLIERLLARPERQAVFLGDNAGRPGITPRPPLFRLAERRGVPVLPGSDALPLPDHETRAGCYGFLVEGPLDRRRPASSLAAALEALRRAPKARPRIFGRCRDLLGFCRDQSALRLQERR